MALSKTIEYTPDGFSQPAVLQNAYIRVESISGNKTSLIFSVVAYNKQNTDMVSAQIMSFAFVPNMNGNNFIKQAYEHLKTVPAFEGATDC